MLDNTDKERKELNISNINPGDIYSYKELCLKLEELPTTGNAKPAQLADWQRYFSYTKLGTKFTIIKLYDMPIPKSVRKGEEDLERYATTLIENLVDEIELENRDLEGLHYQEVFLKKHEIYQACGFVGELYYDFKQKYPREYRSASNRTYPVAIEEIIHFYQATSTELHDILKGLLGSLKSRNILFWEKTFKCFDLKENRTRFCTFEEMTMIQNIELEILKAYKTSSKYIMFAKGNKDKFYSDRETICTDRLQIHKLNEGYRLGFTSNLEDKFEYFKLNRVTEKEKLENKLKTNEITIKKVVQNAEKRYNSRVKVAKIDENSEIKVKKSFGINIKEMSSNRTEAFNATVFNANYLENYKKLSVLMKL